MKSTVRGGAMAEGREGARSCGRCRRCAPARDACAQGPPREREGGRRASPGEGGTLEPAGPGRGGGGKVLISGEGRMWEGRLRRKQRGPRGRDVSWERRRPFWLLPGEKRRTLSSGEAPTAHPSGDGVVSATS